MQFQRFSGLDFVAHAARRAADASRLDSFSPGTSNRPDDDMPILFLSKFLQQLRFHRSEGFGHGQEIADATNRFRRLDRLHDDFKNLVAPAEHTTKQFEDAAFMQALQHLKTSKYWLGMLDGRLLQPRT